MPAKRYSPDVPVRTLRFSPAPWLTTVTLTPGTTAPLGSVMAPETVASWVCDHAPIEKRPANTAATMQDRYSLRFFVIATLNLGPTVLARIQRRVRKRAVFSTVRGGTTLFRRRPPGGARPHRSTCLNSQLSHLVDQRRTRQSEPIGRSVLASNQPVGLLQCFEDMFPIGVGKGAGSALRALRHRLRQAQRQAQHRPGRKEHRALNEILQFANIAWPVVA